MIVIPALRPFLPAMLCALVIVILSAIPGSQLPHFDWWSLLSLDKVGHAAAYGLLTFLLVGGRTGWRGAPLSLPAGWWMVLAATLFGILMEWMQFACVRGRTYDGADMLANGTGSVLGWLLYARLVRV